MLRNTFTPSRARFAMLATMLMAAPAMAQWSGKGELGVAMASGNTDTTTANAKVGATRKVDAWEFSANLAGLYVRNDGVTTARRWELGAQTRYSFSPQTFWYGGARYEEDRFSGFDHQGVVSTGVGRKFIDSEQTKLSGQVGVGYKFYRTIGTLLVPADSDSNITGVAGLDFEHQLNGSTKVFNRFGAEVTSSNNFLQNEVGIAVKMSDRLALAVAWAVRHNTDPPVGFKKTDTLSTVNLVYEVK